MRKWSWLIIAGLCICGWALPLRAEGGMNLNNWIARVLAENPDYRLTLQQYQLNVQSLVNSDKAGLKDVNFSMSPLTISNKSVSLPAMGINYTGSLPYQINFYGNNMVELNNGKMQLFGSLKLDLNVLDLWAAGKDNSERLKYLAEANSLVRAQSEVIRKFLDQYFGLLDNYYRQQIAAKQVELAQYKERQELTRYKAGLISEILLANAQDKTVDALAYCNELQIERQKAMQELAWFFGRQVADASLDVLPEGDALPELATTSVDAFIQKWDPTRLESDYLPHFYEYIKAVEEVKEAEKTLAQAKNPLDWQLHLSARVDYGTQVNDLTVRGLVGLERELYKPSIELAVKQAQLQLDRQRLELQQLKTRLGFELLGAVSAVQEADDSLTRALATRQTASERMQRLEKQNEQGYLTKEDMILGQIALLEKTAAVLKARQNLIEAKIALGNMLCLEDFYK